MKFNEFGLNEHLLEAISYMGFEDATPIQDAAIPEIMKGRDVLAFAQTGTGKTAAFILPILHKLTQQETKDVNTLVIAPTRELAIQIERQIQGFAYFVPVNSYAVYGGGDGADWGMQRKALTSNTDIIVATPGKLISHLQMGYVKFGHVQTLILDEADRMLDMGFYDDILTIMTHLPKKRQNLLFSATMPPRIREMAKQFMDDPFEVSIAVSKPAEGITQLSYLTYQPKKPALVKQIIEDHPECTSILIFTSTKKKVFEVVRELKGMPYAVSGISSDLDQHDRIAVLSDFRSRKIRVLIATDVISRGIDIKDINMVINYDVPNDAEDYVHRIGRTARAETTGIGITLVSEVDMYKLKAIEDLIEKEIPKLPLPGDLGEGPEWNPRPQRGGRGGGGGGRGRSGGGGGGRGRSGGGGRSGGSGGKNGSRNRGGNRKASGQPSGSSEGRSGGSGGGNRSRGRNRGPRKGGSSSQGGGQSS